MKRLLSGERRTEIKKNLIKWLKSAGYTILPFVFKKITDKTNIELPNIPKDDNKAI